MQPDRRAFLTLGALVLSDASVTAASPKAPFQKGTGWIPLLNGRDLSGWRTDLGADKVPSGGTEWFTATSVSWSEDSSEHLKASSQPGGIIVNGLSARTLNLVTERKFKDYELYLEFMLARGSNSGVYHHGLYEVQIFDSYGSTRPMSFGDAGGIYQRWDNGKGFGGFAPRVNPSGPPGQWQSLHTLFHGPRFDATGRKINSARFERVTYNGKVVHENVEVDGPTRSSMKIPEAAENPLMLQGDHGPVAFRNIYLRPLRK